MFKYYQTFVQYYKDGYIYNCNMIYLIKLYSKLTLFQDIDYEALELDKILLDLFFNPIKEEKSAYNIMMKTNPDFINRYEGLSLGEKKPKKETENSDSGSDSGAEDNESEASMG
jgi:hypothetical protein